MDLADLPFGAWAAAGYAVVSAVTYATYAADKRRAVRGERRVPERTLHLLGLAGGWPGAYLARRVVRHKTRKLGFSLVLHATALLHVAVWVLCLRG